MFHCGLFSVVLDIGKCKFISTIHIYFYLHDYTKAKIYNFVFKSSCIENIFLQEINIIPWPLGCYLNHNFSN